MICACDDLCESSSAEGWEALAGEMVGEVEKQDGEQHSGESWRNTVCYNGHVGAGGDTGLRPVVNPVKKQAKLLDPLNISVSPLAIRLDCLNAQVLFCCSFCSSYLQMCSEILASVLLHGLRAFNIRQYNIRIRFNTINTIYI